MEPKEAIFTRRSVRSYLPEPLDDDAIKKVEGWIAGAKRLTDDPFQYDLLGPEEIKTLLKWRAPHYISIYSKDDMMSGVNVGFVFQQVDLMIQSHGLGSCWLGMAKPADPKPRDGLGWGVSMSFGKPDGYPEVDKGSNRKSLGEISDTADPRLEPARLAPSAVNSQTWYFKKNGDGFDLYYKPKVLKIPGMSYWNYNDLGICLAHLYVSHPDTFSFEREGGKEKKYVGTVRFRRRTYLKCVTHPPDMTTVIMHTSMGNIVIKMHDDMPITTGNFVKLANEGFYDGVIFHRVIDEFMIQGGDPDGNGRGGPGYTIQDEFGHGHSNVRGTIAMANTGRPNTGGSQFFINVVDNVYLDKEYVQTPYAHPVFGTVISGMEVADAISKVKTDANDKPLRDVVIERMEVVDD